MYGKILIRCDLEVRTGMHIGGSSAFSAIVLWTARWCVTPIPVIPSHPAAA